MKSRIYNRTGLAVVAAKAAYHWRRTLGHAAWAPVSVFDDIRKTGVQIRFVDLTNVDGLYSSTMPPAILLGAHRPVGRQSFTCAHEFAHHLFEHGVRFDKFESCEPATSKLDPDEFVADMFAACLLMPKAAVCRGFRMRGWNPSGPSPTEVYHVSHWLGVSYDALVCQLRLTLNLISVRDYKALSRVTPAEIKLHLSGTKCPGEVLSVDENWVDRPIDCQVNDYIIIPRHLLIDVSRVAEVVARDGFFHCKVIKPGLGRVFSQDNSWGAFIRVSRRGYLGLSEFRHMEEAEDE